MAYTTTDVQALLQIAATGVVTREARADLSGALAAMDDAHLATMAQGLASLMREEGWTLEQLPWALEAACTLAGLAELLAQVMEKDEP